MVDVAFIIPTRDRAEHLAHTLRGLGGLDPIGMTGEVVIVDNASTVPVDAPAQLENGFPVQLIREESNLAAAARNRGAVSTAASWLCMLDDDSHPTDARFVDAIRDAPDDVGAIGGRIRLVNGGHDRGGLPEVFTGCGALVRRDLFVNLGGYDPVFEYYAEEYDLCAQLIAHGFRITHDARFRVMHHKVDAGRDLGRILKLLVRNNGWVIRRYTPQTLQDTSMEQMVARYRRIAQKEDVVDGFEEGLGALIDTIDEQVASPLTAPQYERFTGRAAVRDWLPNAIRRAEATKVAIVAADKHVEIVESVITESGVAEIVPNPSDADAAIIGTLAPGPILDARQAWVGRASTVIPSWPVFGDLEEALSDG